MRAWIVLCAAAAACSHPVSVHGGNLIELDAAAGTVEITAVGSLTGVSPQPTLTLTVPVVPWQGRTVAAVPLLPVSGGDSWALSYKPQFGRARSATLVANPVAGVAGSAAIDFIDAIAKTDQSLAAPQDPEQLALFNRDVNDLHSTAGYLKNALQQAQTVPSPVGAWKSVTVNLDGSGLSFLDGAVKGAQEPVVALFSPALAATGQSTAAFALLLDAAAVLAMPNAADFAAPYTNVTAMGADFLAEILGEQLMSVLLAADRTHDPESAALAGVLAQGDVRVQTFTANHVVESNATGAIRFGAHQSGRLPTLQCDPAQCALGTACLNCNAVWNGCFAGGGSCCGAGFWSIACDRGDGCAVCNGIWTCLPPGASCPATIGTGTVAGDGLFAPDGGTPGGDADAGPGGPTRCGVVNVPGGDAADQRIFEMGKDAGAFVFEWNTYGIADKIAVSYEDKVIFDSGCVGGSGSPTLPFHGASTQVTVSVTPDCKAATSGSQWEYTVSCPP
ncbi:MAG: hypothetical protein ACXWLM_05145 [Myxococcales bacterium]